VMDLVSDSHPCVPATGLHDTKAELALLTSFDT